MNVSTLYYVAADNIPSASITDKCVVLDLDQTLIATQEDMASLKQLDILKDPQLLPLRSRTYYITIEDLEKPGIGTKYDFWGVTRPHVKEFLLFCFSYFKIVAVWSAGQRPYVEAIVDDIFRDLPKPHIIFSHDDVDVGPGGRIEKPLNKMIESHPVLRRFMSLQNTLAIDDNCSTFRNNNENGILIPAYDPALSVSAMGRDDPTLLQLKYWLLQPEVVSARDVTTLDKSTIFTTSLDTYRTKLQNLPGYKFM